jgi:multiple sugar transport system substrate-binding protein
MIDEFNRTHTDIQAKLTIIPQEQFVQKVATAYRSGDAPDITSVDLIYVPYFAKAGAFEDVTDIYNSAKYKDQWSRAHVALSKYKNKMYSLPFTAEGSVLFWNKDLFKKAGLNPEAAPKTMAEILSAAKKISALGDDIKGYYFSGACSGCNIFTFAPYIWAQGGDVLNKDGSPNFASKEAKVALKFYKDLWDAGTVPASAKNDNGSSFAAPFLTGKVGMVGAGAFFIPGLVKDHPEIKFGVTPLPGAKAGQSSSFAGGDNIAVLKGTKHPKEAKEFLAWATDKGQEFLATQPVLPTRLDVAKKAYVPLDPVNYKVMYDALLVGKTPWTTSYNSLIQDNQGPWLKMFTGAIFGGNIDAAQKAAQSQALKIYKKEK